MNRKIRRSVFETNSSSCHSISIASGGEVLDKLPVDERGVCRVYPGEFGWEIDTHYDAATKASYALTWALSCQTYKVGNKKESLELLRRVIQEATGCKKVVFGKGESEWYRGGYIDHQSIEYDGGPGKEAFESEDTLRRFIFNPKSVLVTDNDNH